MRHFLAAFLWLSLAMIHQVHRTESRSSLKIGDPQISRAPDLGSVDMKADDRSTVSDAAVKRKIYLEEDLVCNCNDYCLDSESSELDVSKPFCLLMIFVISM